jgi:hypothetical protein
MSNYSPGVRTVADGSAATPRTDRTSGPLANIHGDLFEAAYRSGLFSVANQAGVTSQAGLSATTPVLTLANPPGSGKLLLVHEVRATFLVAFAAAAAVWVATGFHASTLVTGTLTVTHRNLKLGGGDPSGRPFLAATLPAAPVGIDLLGSGLTGAITTTPVVQAMVKDYKGGLILTPGANLSVQTSTASGASSSLFAYTWEEIDE